MPKTFPPTLVHTAYSLKMYTMRPSSLIRALFLAGVALATCTDAFAPQQKLASTRCTVPALFFGLPSFFTPKSEDDAKASKATKAEAKKSEKKIGLSGVLQLITAGAGAPFLGEFEGVDEETGKFMFSLEANNLVDEKGNSKQTAMPYFENGWVDPEDEARAKEGFKFPWQK